MCLREPPQVAARFLAVFTRSCRIRTPAMQAPGSAWTSSCRCPSLWWLPGMMVWQASSAATGPASRRRQAWGAACWDLVRCACGETAEGYGAMEGRQPAKGLAPLQFACMCRHRSVIHAPLCLRPSEGPASWQGHACAGTGVSSTRPCVSGHLRGRRLGKGMRVQAQECHPCALVSQAI